MLIFLVLTVHESCLSFFLNLEYNKLNEARLRTQNS